MTYIETLMENFFHRRIKKYISAGKIMGMPKVVTTTERDLLTNLHVGTEVYNTTTVAFERWNGTTWV